MKPEELASPDLYNEELHYWRMHYSKMGRSDLKLLASPKRPLSKRVLDAVGDPKAGMVISILDVGCGPISVLGWFSPTMKVKLTGADPLANHYNRLLSEFKINLPYRVFALGGEELLDEFRSDSFDYVFSRNALDHAYDTPACIKNMLSLTRMGGIVELEVFENEAVAAAYSGLHRWNFCQLDEQILVWNRTSVNLLDDIVSPYPYTFEALPTGDDKGKVKICIKIHKRPPTLLEHLSVPGIVDIYSNLERRILQFSQMSGDRSKKFFVHSRGLTKENTLTMIAKSYHWPHEGALLNIRIPPLERLDSISVGQFEVQFKENNQYYINLWKVDIASSSSKPKVG